jgi:hypothetical protein
MSIARLLWLKAFGAGGMDLTMTPDAGLAGSSDEEQLSFAWAEGRVIFTQDHGFLALHAAGSPHAGIAYCHQNSRGLGDILDGLLLIHACFTPDGMRNCVEWL